MTRGSIPPFDLYEELEVSRQATPSVIEAAHRALVKRHHPDVSASADLERITRLNIARDWLLDPVRRARYDGGPAADTPIVPRPSPRERRSGMVATARPARPSSPASFGVHSREVRRFLGELRELDAARTRLILDAKAALDPVAYTEARGASLAASRPGRNDEWGFARDAASVIARGKVVDAAAGAIVASVAADIAGAIVVRDLITAEQFDLLRAPWTRSAPVLAPAPAQPERPERVARAPITLAGTAGLGRRPALLAVAAAGLAVLIAVALFAGGKKPESAVAGLTSDPSSGVVAPGGTETGSATGPVGLGGSLDPTASLDVGQTSSPGLSVAPTASTPGRTPPPIGATPTPRISPSPKPTASPSPGATASPHPTTVPTPTPTAPPTPTPVPTPTATPRVTCTVVNLVGVNTSNAQVTWSTAGFTGKVVFLPVPPPQYKITWQSLAVGLDVPCTSDVIVQQTAP